MSGPDVSTAKRPIPMFSSRQEEAAFWDTHDLTDYFDFEQRRDVLRVETPLSERLTFDIDSETMEEVRAAAEAREMPVDVLLQIWILERRDAERARRATTEQAGRSADTSD